MKKHLINIFLTILIALTGVTALRADWQTDEIKRNILRQQRLDNIERKMEIHRRAQQAPETPEAEILTSKSVVAVESRVVEGNRVYLLVDLESEKPILMVMKGSDSPDLEKGAAGFFLSKKSETDLQEIPTYIGIALATDNGEFYALSGYEEVFGKWILNDYQSSFEIQP